MIPAEHLLQGPALLFGILGAVCISTDVLRHRQRGFALWVGGNTLWVIWGLVTGNLYVVCMFGFYLGTSVLGLSNTLRRDR